MVCGVFPANLCVVVVDLRRLKITNKNEGGAKMNDSCAIGVAIKSTPKKTDTPVSGVSQKKKERYFHKEVYR